MEENIKDNAKADESAKAAFERQLDKLKQEAKVAEFEKEVMKNNTEEIVKRSGGAVKKASNAEIDAMTNYISPYVNKFMCSVLRNNMVHIGFVLESNEDHTKFVTAIMTDIQCVANLHALLTQVLTQFQQQQMKQMQELQGKINPQFAEQMKMAQEAKKN